MSSSVSVPAGAGPATALRILGGKLPPPDLAHDLRGLSRLPVAARASVWSVLGPCLVDPLPAETERLLEGYSRAHRLEREDLAPPIKASRFVLREAARADVDRAVFADEVGALVGVGHAAAVQEILLAGFDEARSLVRAEILRGTIADHGKLVTAVDWRVDSIQASSRGARIRIPVTLLTLRYREGDETRRVTLQVLPDELRRMKEILNELVP